MSNKLSDLLDDLDVYTQNDREHYQQFNFEKIEIITKQGTFQGAVLIDGNWIPKSQLRCDFDKNLYISLWKYAQIEGNL